jgi:hypothetical protein
MFPVDDFTLTQLEHALGTCKGEDGLVGGEFTLSMLLDFLSGADESRSTLIDERGGIPVFECWDARYSEHDVIRALIGRIRELEACVSV